MKADFGIEIDFQKGPESPSRVFRAMAELVESFEEIDKDLIQSINIKIEPVLILEDIETGSLKAWFRTLLEKTDDDALKNLNWRPQVGRYLVRAKYIIINFLEDKTEISNREQMEGLSRKLHQHAKDTDVLRIPTYAPIPILKIGKAIEKISESVSKLNPTDEARFVMDEDKARFNIEFNYSPESIEELLTKETITHRQEMILKVKKPDYLGESMWDFRYEDRTIHAKVMDVGWLKDFQFRKVEVRPGDALRTKVEMDVNYGYEGEVIGIKYTIIEVMEILPFQTTEQRNFPLE